MNSKISYRADIDGLRAVAVLSVLFYHAGITVFSGGYIGVDVFFVISGYLITSIIVKEIRANEFSLLKFYERRIRRIYPALYTTLLFILIAAYLLYDPHNYLQTGKGSMATIGFMSNILFWTESGYFDAPSTLKPLLHTWSLAVEEQFYISYPLLLMMILRYAPKWLREILGAIVLLSFIFSLYYTKQNASAAFYFTHLRAWELLIGGLLAINAVPVRINPMLRHVLSVAGLAMILWAVLSYTDNTSFPGVGALLPVIGSALIIYSGMERSSWAGKILGLPLFVFIGKISYSLYLWHWPIIILGRYYLIKDPNTMQMFFLVTASFLFSILSWTIIEKPFRTKSFLPAPGIFIFAGSVMTIAIIISGTIYLKAGMPERIPDDQLKVIEKVYSKWGEDKKCNKTDPGVFKEFNRCILGDDTAAPSFIIWGDSHALALAPALDASARREGASGYLASQSACPPLLGVDRVGESACYDFNNTVMEHVIAHPEWETVFLAGRWALSTSGERYKNEEGTNIILVDSTSPSASASNADLVENGLDRTVTALQNLGRKVVIIASVPEVGYDVPSSYFIAARTGRDINAIIAPTFDEYLERNGSIFNILNALQNRYNIQIIDPADRLCDQSVCNVVTDGQLLYQDGHHLSVHSTPYISHLFDPAFEK
jgi:peptidoglycan/LPS O-acetylase OafA/YrhL